MRKAPKNLNEKKAMYYYVVRKWPLRKVSKILDCDRRSLTRFLKKKNIQIRSRRENLSSLVGKKLGRWTAIEEKSDKWTIRYVCICDCGTKRLVARQNLVNGASQSCGCLCKEKTSTAKWTGYKEISGRMWGNIKRRAKQHRRELNITIKDAWELFLKQNKKCALSGVDLVLSAKYPSDLEVTASLDRIDSDKGYTKDNCQWVHKDINWMKQDYNQQEFISWCEKVARFNGKTL